MSTHLGRLHFIHDEFALAALVAIFAIGEAGIIITHLTVVARDTFVPLLAVLSAHLDEAVGAADAAFLCSLDSTTFFAQLARRAVLLIEFAPRQSFLRDEDLVPHI